MEKLSGRDFSRAVTTAGISTALGRARVAGAKDRVRLGFIGLGNRGDQVLDAFLVHRDATRTSIGPSGPRDG